MKLSTKFISIFFILAVLPTILIGFFSYRASYQVLWNHALHTTAQSVQQVEDMLNRIFVKTEYFSDMAQEDCVREYINGNVRTYENNKEILNIMESYKRNIDLGDSVHDVYLLGKDGDVLTYRNGHISREKMGVEDDLSGERNMRIYKGNQNPNPFYQDQQFIYVEIPLIMKSLREPYGQVILELKSDILQDFCDTNRIMGAGYFFIADGQGNILFSPEEAKCVPDSNMLEQTQEGKKGSFLYEQGGQSLMFTYNEISRTGWKLIGQIPMTSLMEDANEIRNTVFRIIAGIAVLTIFLYIYFSNKFILPLRKLNATMQMASLGDMSVRFHGSSRDEIQELGNSFNFMLEQIDRLTKQDRKKQLHLQKAELDILQAQINPHFLYNTLDTIIWQAKAGSMENVITTADALADFFRTTLSEGRSWVTVREELEMLRSYLTIQKLRYGNILDYEIQIEDAILEYKMLKLILQPIVENAIYHGLKNRRDGGLLRVRGYALTEGSEKMHSFSESLAEADRKTKEHEKREGFVFQVEDTGVGMPVGKLRELQEQLRRQAPGICANGKGGFGIANVNGRIKLYYGEAYGISVESAYQEGTVVTIYLGKES